MPHDTGTDKEKYQTQLSSSDKVRLRSSDNVVKENVRLFENSLIKIPKNREMNRYTYLHIITANRKNYPLSNIHIYR